MLRGWCSASSPEVRDRDEHDLSAGERLNPAVEIGGREPDRAQLFVGARLDVPVLADRLEALGGDVAGLDGRDGVDDLVPTSPVRPGWKEPLTSEMAGRPSGQPRESLDRTMEDVLVGRGDLESRERSIA